MKILFTEHNFCLETPVKLQQAGHEVFIVKEEIEGVHEFDRTALLATLKDIRPEILVIGFKFKLDKEIIDSAPIKAIFTRSTGKDHIALDYAKEKGIEVVPLYGSELGDVVAVPELCLWAMLELVRRRGGRELKGKNLGVIGWGRIGRLLTDYAVHLGMETFEIDIKSMDLLPQLLKESNIVSLHISSTEENRGFMNKAKFEQMKNGSYFLNSSRGWLVDESALKWALENKLAGAWSDFPVSFEHPKLIITPHLGGKTLESSQKTEVILINKLLEWLKSH